MSLTRDSFFWESFTNHIQRSIQAAGLLEQMLASPKDAQELYKQLHDLEHNGDSITREVVLELHKTWITPLDRDAIHSLITTLDDVLDYIDAAAGRFTLYELDPVRPEAIEMAVLATKGCQEAARALALLKDMKNAPTILEICTQLNRIESDTDKIYRRALTSLFKDEPKGTIYIMKWRDIFDSLEAVSDRLEDISDIMESVVLEHS
jgi:predicted phosphate transport protein (TIGR00153 family)